MAGGLIEVQADTFEQEIATSLPVVLDFWAEWCGPCKKLIPVLEEVAQEMGGELKILKVNVDNNQEVASKFQVMSIPTIVFMKDGAEVERMVGAMSKDSFIKKVTDVFSI